MKSNLITLRVKILQQKYNFLRPLSLLTTKTQIYNFSGFLWTGNVCSRGMQHVYYHRQRIHSIRIPSLSFFAKWSCAFLEVNNWKEVRHWGLPQSTRVISFFVKPHHATYDFYGVFIEYNNRNWFSLEYFLPLEWWSVLYHHIQHDNCKDLIRACIINLHGTLQKFTDLNLKGLVVNERLEQV